jgi:ubiquinone biosynthesis protein
MAMRPDFLAQEYVDELATLLDDVPPFPTPDAVRIVEAELGGPILDRFRAFDGEPVASASFGQVYRAELSTGEIVAVKVQRPGIERVVSVDLRILSLISRLMDASTLLLSVKLHPIYEDFAVWTRDELDYRVEARYATDLREDRDEAAGEIIPRVYEQLSTRRVLTLEYLHGHWVNDLIAGLATDRADLVRRLAAEGIELDEVARTLVRIVLRQVFVRGVFHADPHAANIVVMPQSRVGLVDFGIVGVMSDEFKRDMLKFFEEVGERRPSGAFRAALRLVDVPNGADLGGFRREFERNLQDWMIASRDPRASLREKSSARLLMGNLAVMRKYQIRLPAVVLRFFRALVIVDSVVLQLHPELDLLTEIQLIIREIVLEQLQAQLTVESYLRAILQFEALLVSLPRTLSELVDVQLRDFARELVQTGRTVRRFSASAAAFAGTLGILGALAALVLGVSGRFTSSAEASWQTVAVLALVAGLGLRWVSRRIRSA